MRVFVAGATGAIGRPLVPQLLEAGHEVVGLTRSEERAAGLRAQGAEAAVADALDANAFRAAVMKASPDVVVHQLTDLPHEFTPKYQYGQTGALRSQGCAELIDAARAAGARRVIAQSIAFLYEPAGDLVKDETAPTKTPERADGKIAEALRGTLDMERQVTQADGMEGLVLRYGFFYGPGTWYAAGTSLAKRFERRMFPVVGNGAGMFSFIHVDDAAAATVAAVERGETGIYNIVDDEPAPAREWIPVFAEALGAPKPRRVPAWLARLVAGRYNTAMLETLRGASNAKAKRELAWEPRYASWRQGFREGLS